jgi:polypeptide N-acetylgalactosaminyltransferase
MIHHDEILLNELLNTYNSDLKDWPYIGHPGYLSLQSLPQRHLYNSYAVFPGANSIRNHGILGVFPNKTPAYIPAPLPPKITKVRVI